jgi:RNA polymerase sigma-70 factor (sigma-E family)
MAGEDEAAFSAFVRAASRSLQRTAWLLTGDWALAEDLVQSSLLTTWRHWSDIEVTAAPGYTRKVMFRTFLAWRGRKWAGELARGSLPDAPTDATESDLADDRLAITQAVLALPRRQRAVIVLRFFDDLSERDAAHALGCSVGTVKSHTSRALGALRLNPTLTSGRD